MQANTSSMRYFYLVIFSFVGIISCSSCSSEYKIDGSSTVQGFNGQKLYLRLTTDGVTRDICLDSCEIVHGTFNFSGAVDSVAMAELYMGSYPMMPVVLENGDLFVQMDNMLQTVSGGPLNNLLNDFLTKHMKLENDLWDLDRRARCMIYEGKSVEDIILTLDPIRRDVVRKMQNLEVHFVKQNYDNPLGPGYFIRMCNSEIHDTAEEVIHDILRDATPKFLAHPFVQHYMAARGITVDPPIGRNRRTASIPKQRTTTDSTRRSRRKVQQEVWE